MKNPFDTLFRAEMLNGGTQYFESKSCQIALQLTLPTKQLSNCESVGSSSIIHFALIVELPRPDRAHHRSDRTYHRWWSVLAVSTDKNDTFDISADWISPASVVGWLSLNGGRYRPTLSSQKNPNLPKDLQDILIKISSTDPVQETAQCTHNHVLFRNQFFLEDISLLGVPFLRILAAYNKEVNLPPVELHRCAPLAHDIDYLEYRWQTARFQAQQGCTSTYFAWDAAIALQDCALTLAPRNGGESLSNRMFNAFFLYMSPLASNTAEYRTMTLNRSEADSIFQLLADARAFQKATCCSLDPPPAGTKGGKVQIGDDEGKTTLPTLVMLELLLRVTSISTSQALPPYRLTALISSLTSAETLTHSSVSEPGDKEKLEKLCKEHGLALDNLECLLAYVIKSIGRELSWNMVTDGVNALLKTELKYKKLKKDTIDFAVKHSLAAAHLFGGPGHPPSNSAYTNAITEIAKLPR